MTEPARARRRPGPAAVLWGSLALFAVLFALLAHQLSAGEPASDGTAATRPVQVRKVIERRVVTTIVPGSGPDTVTAGPTAVTAGPASTSSYAAAVEPVTTSAS